MQKTIPIDIQRLFWEVDKKKLDITTDRKSIVERVLNYGTLADWRWLMNTYGTQGVREVLAARGELPRTNIREQSRRLFSMLTESEK